MKVTIRRNADAPIDVEDVFAIIFEIGDCRLEIKPQPDGGVRVDGGALDPIVIEPQASNSCVIRERRRR